MRLVTTMHMARLAAIATILLTCEQAICQEVSPYTFIQTGPASWNIGSNWDLFDVPQASLNEVAIIPENRSVFVDNAPPTVGGITLSAGTLEIRPGGTLTSGTGSVATGEVTVGQTGVGNLIIRRGGTLTTQNLVTGGATTSQLTLGETGGAGIAKLQTTGASLGRMTRIVGPNVDFSNAGDVTLTGQSILNPVITGATHSAIKATGTAILGGTVRPEISGYTPVLGNSWNLVTAGAVEGEFASFDNSLLPATPRGTGFTLSKTSTAAALRYTNKLILTYDRVTRNVKIDNVVGSPINFDAYSIASSGGYLGGTWNSLADQGLAGWDEADNSNSSRRTEFNSSSSTTINVGASRSVGSPYLPPLPTAIGQTVEDLSFSYAVPGQGTVEGIVEYTGRHNNLVLTINPATGAAAIQNQSPYFDVDIDGYTIASASGKLLVADGKWNSLDDQGLSTWDQADNSNANRLTEFNPEATTFMAGNGTVLNLGTPVNVSGGALSLSDFTFDFAINTPLGGDYNDDGSVDAADYTVWRNHLGSPTFLPNDNTPGVGPDDYTRWKINFGKSGGSQTVRGIVAFGTIPGAGSGSLLSTSTVPEPTAIVNLMLCSSIVSAWRTRYRGRGYCEI